MTVYVDLTEFLRAPHRTGIQRVCGELCKSWPKGSDLIPVKLTTTQRLVPLPSETLHVICRYFEASDDQIAVLERRLADLSMQSEASEETIVPSANRKLLVPEVFFQPERIRFFRCLPPEQITHCGFIVHDILALTHPEFFPPDMPHEIISGYFRLVRTVQNVAFNSASTRDAFGRRLLRHASGRGPVVQLGSDGLGPRPTSLPKPHSDPTFTVVGTIEPRKNHRYVVEAFEPLLRQIEGLRLVFVGKIGWSDPAFAQKVQWMANGGCTGFEHYGDARDEDVRLHVQESRATIFISSAEGFGLPPVESLWLGVPVIASPGIPSLENYDQRGIHMLDGPRDTIGLRKAVLAFLDSSYQRKKAEEALALDLPTWSSVAAATAAWIEGS